MLEDKNGNVVGTDSQEYDTLGIGEQIGGMGEALGSTMNIHESPISPIQSCFLQH